MKYGLYTLAGECLTVCDFLQEAKEQRVAIVVADGGGRETLIAGEAEIFISPLPESMEEIAEKQLQWDEGNEEWK